MSTTAQGPDMASSLGDLGGPMLGKTAADQFEKMDKTAQVKILANKQTPVLVKLALALHHVKAPPAVRVKLAKAILKQAR